MPVFTPYRVANIGRVCVIAFVVGYPAVKPKYMYMTFYLHNDQFFFLTYMISFKTEIIFHVSRAFYQFTETFKNVSIARFLLEDTKEVNEQKNHFFILIVNCTQVLRSIYPFYQTLLFIIEVRFFCLQLLVQSFLKHCTKTPELYLSP